MIGKKSDTIKLDLDISKSNITNSYVACVVNTFNPLDNSIIDSFQTIFEEIEDVKNQDVRELLEKAYYDIHQFYLNNNNEFLKLSRQSSCSLGIDPNLVQIQNIIKFWIIFKYHNSDMDMILIAKSFGEFKICESNIWLFSPSKSVTTSIEKSIAIMKHFLKVANLDFIKNGKCYMSKIALTTDFACLNCENGLIELGNKNEIIEDFVDGKKNAIEFNDKLLQSDFISIQIKRDIEMYCGNCMADIEKVPDNISLLTK